MIHLEITRSRKLDLIGMWDYHKNEVRIGHEDYLINDIRVLDEIKSSQALIQAKEDQLICDISLDRDIVFYVNQKRSIGRVFLNKDDVLQIGSTLIKIIDFKETQDLVRNDLDQALEKIVKENHPLNELIKITNDELRKI